MNHTINANGMSLGRVASRAAHLLMEKDRTAFEKHFKRGASVTVMNAGKINFTEKRLDAVRYARASGYPGNLVKESIRTIKNRRGIAEVVRRAVYGMLPNNKLRPTLMKRLTVSE